MLSNIAPNNPRTKIKKAQRTDADEARKRLLRDDKRTEFLHRLLSAYA